MVAKLRTTRIAERIREDLSEIMVLHIQDPRLSGVSITDVTVDRELAFADVYYSSLEGSERAAEVLAGFQHAQGFLRSELARRIDLRTFPRLRFHFDPTFERAARIEKLFTEIHANDTAPQEKVSDKGEDESE
jgi:ribosome-binding factor A